MSSPIFDATFGTGRFRREEPMTTSDQSQAAADARLIEALQQIIDNCDDNSAPQCRHDLTLKFVREIALRAIHARAADRSVHGELIPDCPTEGVAARQGNGG